jgi:DNA-binding transcriptional ArsR family regulator
VSIRLMTLVWDIRWPTQNHLLVMLKLADHANDEGSKVWPAVSTLAEQAQCSERTVQNVLKALRDSGLASVVKQGGGASPTIYALNVPLLRALADVKAELTGTSDAIMIPADAYLEAGMTGATVAPPANFAPVQPETPTGATGDMTGAKLLHPNHHKEPSREPSLPPTPPQDGGSEGEGEGLSVSRIVGPLPVGTEHTGMAIARIATTIRVDHENRAALFAQIAAELKGYAEPELDAIAREVIRTRKKIVSPKCVLDCVRAALEALPSVTIVEGDPRFDAWSKFYATKPGMISLGKKHGFTVRSNWPPGYSPHAAEGGSGGGAQSSAAPAGRAVGVASGHDGEKP